MLLSEFVHACAVAAGERQLLPRDPRHHLGLRFAASVQRRLVLGIRGVVLIRCATLREPDVADLISDFSDILPQAFSRHARQEQDFQVSLAKLSRGQALTS